jgi:hypothetical protein
LLNWTWFGYPLHPVIIDMPIMAWTFTTIVVIIWLISPAHNTWSSVQTTIALVGQASYIGSPFFVVTVVLFPSVLFVGLLTLKRVPQSGIEDLTYTRGLTRAQGCMTGAGISWYNTSVEDEQSLYAMGME